MLVMNTKQESHESRYKTEETTYDNLPETRIVIVKDGFVTFFRHFKYLGSWISFSLREDHDMYEGSLHCYIPENESEHPVLGWNKSRTLRRSPKTLISHFQNVPRPKTRPKNWKNRRDNESNSGGKTS